MSLRSITKTDPDSSAQNNEADLGGGRDDAADPDPDAAGPECAPGDSRQVACGLNGRGTANQVCVGESWGEPSECIDLDECLDDDMRTAPCGRNARGAIEQVCTAGMWAPNGMCADLDVCTDDDTRLVACGLNGRGTQEQTCLAGMWDASAPCTDPDPCVDGTNRVLSCGLNDRGALSQTCAAGDWVDDAACVDPDVCVDGTMQSIACGLNDRGAQAQTCSGGTWLNQGTCVGADVCTDDATQTVSCGLNGNGTRPERCVVGAWQPDGACDDPDVCQNGTTQQVMCGFDGTQDQLCAAGVWTNVGGCVEPLVDFCRTQPATLQAVLGQPTGTIDGVVYVETKTPGAGPAAGVVGEVAWGIWGTSPVTWTNTAPAIYARDEDGLVAGDLANDVWQATITSGTAGNFSYLFRFSADNGTTWQFCDTAGTVDGNFDNNALGFLVVNPPNTPDHCQIEFPNLVYDAQVGQAIDVYGRVTEVGLTGMGSAAAGVVGELLVGPAGANPRTSIGVFDIVPAAFNAAALNLGPDQDEYGAAYTPQAAGTRAFAFRFSVDGGTNWSYCAMQDAAVNGAFAPVKMGWLNASAGTPDVVDFCHVWQDTLADDAAPGTQPTVTVETFEAGVTDSGAVGTAIEAQAAAFALEHNPALDPVTWNPLPFKGTRPGVPQNYEYEGTPYTAATHPAAGTYNVVVRVRASGQTAWTYCDTDDTSAPFRLSAASHLTIAP